MIWYCFPPESVMLLSRPPAKLHPSPQGYTFDYLASYLGQFGSGLYLALRASVSAHSKWREFMTQAAIFAGLDSQLCKRLPFLCTFKKEICFCWQGKGFLLPWFYWIRVSSIWALIKYASCYGQRQCYSRDQATVRSLDTKVICVLFQVASVLGALKISLPRNRPVIQTRPC